MACGHGKGRRLAKLTTPPIWPRSESDVGNKQAERGPNVFSEATRSPTVLSGAKSSTQSVVMSSLDVSALPFTVGPRVGTEPQAWQPWRWARFEGCDAEDQ